MIEKAAEKALYEAKSFKKFRSAEDFRRFQYSGELSDWHFGWMLNLGNRVQLEHEGRLRTLNRSSIYPFFRNARTSLRLKSSKPELELLLCQLSGERSLDYFSYLSPQTDGLGVLASESTPARLAKAYAQDPETYAELDRFGRSAATYRFLSALEQEIEKWRFALASFLTESPESLIKMKSMIPSIKALSRRLRVRDTLLAERLRELWKTPPRRCLRLLKLYHSARLLQQSEASVQSILRHSGYTSSTEFANSFRKEFGCSATEFRQKASGDLHAQLAFKIQQLRDTESTSPRSRKSTRIRNSIQSLDHQGGNPRSTMQLHGRVFEGIQSKSKRQKRKLIGPAFYSKSCHWFLFLEGNRQFEASGRIVELGPGSIISFEQGIYASWITKGSQREKYLMIFSADQQVRQVHSAVTEEFGWYAQLPVDHPFLKYSEAFAEKRHSNRKRKKTLEERHEQATESYNWLCAWHQLMVEHGPKFAKRLDLSRAHMSVSSEERLKAIRSLKNYALKLGFSEAHASRLLQGSSHSTPRNLLRHARIEEGCFLLDDTSMPIAEIASKCGYNHPPSFCKAFKSLIGVTPSTYRMSRRHQ